MQNKTIAMMVAAGCVITMLTGCGIPEEEHNAMIAQLNEDHGKEVDGLKGDIADKESIIKLEKDKTRRLRIELDDATERITGLQQKSAEVSKQLATEKVKTSGLERDLSSSKSATLAAQDQALAAENKLATLEVEHEELARRFEQFEKNMSALGGTPAPAKAAAAADDFMEVDAVVVPKTDAEAALDILNQMGNQ